MKAFWIGLLLAWMALCLMMFGSIYTSGERVWHLSEDAPLEPVEPALADDGSWGQWRDATRAYNEASSESLEKQVSLLTGKGDSPYPDLDLVHPFRDELIAALIVLPDPKPMSGWRIASDDYSSDAPSSLPDHVMDSGRALVARAWIHALDGEGEEAIAKLLAAHHVGVLFEHSGGHLVAVMVGVATQGMVLRNAIKMARLVDVAPLVTAARDAKVLPSGIPAGLAGDCAATGTMLAGVDLTTGKEADLANVGRKLPFAYSTRRTRSLHRYRCRKLIAQARLPLTDRVPVEFPTLLDRTDPRHWFDNPVGRILLDVSMPSFNGLLERRDRLVGLTDQLEAADAR